MPNDMSNECILKEVCSEPQKSRGYCKNHYNAWWKHGDPLFYGKLNHGMSRTPEYYAWCHIKGRCYNKNNPDYPNYGARGIKVCDRWLEIFESFYADMGDRPSRAHTLERRDVNGDYSPENCYWATRTTQAINRRMLKNNTSGYRGVTNQNGRWHARIMIDYTSRNLGCFDTAEEAARAYDKAARQLHGEIAHLNFPD